MKLRSSVSRCRIISRISGNSSHHFRHPRPALRPVLALLSRRPALFAELCRMLLIHAIDLGLHLGVPSLE
jgi:hypothetical protein